MNIYRQDSRSYLIIFVALASLGSTGAGAAFAQDGRMNKSAEGQSLPTDAEFACPMETHPDQEDPAEQGAYYSEEAGKCPWCGMKLKPVEELAWARARQAAGAADVAYTCPEHQHVFSATSGACPRCDKEVKPFKVMYTCPDPKHAHVITTSKGKCPTCGKRLAAFRGIWLDESMASANVPPMTQPAAADTYRCALHPLVHSAKSGRCTICAMELTPGGKPAEAFVAHGGHRHALQIPEGAAYVCPMKECEAFSETEGRCPECGMKLKPIEEVGWAKELAAATTKPAPGPDVNYVCPMKSCEVFSAEAGECPVCGMNLKPVEEVAWAREMLATTRPAGAEAAYICPMHPGETSDSPGTCSICAMQMVRADAHAEPKEAPEQVQQELNHITEHYLTLQRLLASDTTTDIAKHALGIASASEDLLKALTDADLRHAKNVRKSVEQLQSAALKIKEGQLADDRVHFVDLSTSMVALLNHLRPDRDRWPTLYIFHCPMSKGDWVQTGEEKRNPYYGFQMLKCGELKATK